MQNTTNPAKIAIAVIAVVVAVALAFFSYQRFMAPKKPSWTPPANYGAPVPYGAPATPR